MSGEEDYMDQLFKDHFEDFAKSPGDGVWKGIVKNGAMANGKKLSSPPYWKSGLLMCLGLFLTFGAVKGYQVFTGDEEEKLAIKAEVSNFPVTPTEPAIVPVKSEETQEHDQTAQPVSEVSAIEEEQNTFEEPIHETLVDGETEQIESSEKIAQRPTYHLATRIQKHSINRNENAIRSATAEASDEGVAEVSGTDYSINGRNLALNANQLDLNHLGSGAQQATWASFNDPLSVKARRYMTRSWMIKPQDEGKVRGGHWFVSGAFAADAGLESDRKFVLGLDGLAFGAGKYLSPNSFIEVSLRGAWSNGFNMRANYARLFLPGRLRPFIQGGLAWGDRVNVRMGLGLMYTPRDIKKWRFYVAANYEGGFDFGDRIVGETGVFEFGAQLRLSGTERVLSDNNWMNSVPLYELPTGWYADASINFSFDEKTNVVDYSAYMGKYLRRRLFIRGGIRADHNAVAIPVQVQYHFLVRKQLRFGAYTGASIGVQNARLGAELGFIAYYEVLPGWSLFVAPVILEGSSFNERLFETGIQLNLAKKK